MPFTSRGGHAFIERKASSVLPVNRADGSRLRQRWAPVLTLLAAAPTSLVVTGERFGNRRIVTLSTCTRLPLCRRFAGSPDKTTTQIAQRSGTGRELLVLRLPFGHSLP
jgi:hypothetical protein